MKIPHIALIVFGVGMLGGLTNALLSGYITLLPSTEPGAPERVSLPGLLITTFIGGMAAVAP